MHLWCRFWNSEAGWQLAVKILRFCHLAVKTLARANQLRLVWKSQTILWFPNERKLTGVNWPPGRSSGTLNSADTWFWHMQLSQWQWVGKYKWWAIGKSMLLWSIFDFLPIFLMIAFLHVRIYFLIFFEFVSNVGQYISSDSPSCQKVWQQFGSQSYGFNWAKWGCPIVMKFTSWQESPRTVQHFKRTGQATYVREGFHCPYVRWVWGETDPTFSIYW